MVADDCRGVEDMVCVVAAGDDDGDDGRVGSVAWMAEVILSLVRQECWHSYKS